MIVRIKKRFQRARAALVGNASFRDRYELVESRRIALIERLNRLNDQARAHPGHRRALTLLNDKFRKAKVAQRVAILQAAEWLIDVLETLTLMA